MLRKPPRIIIVIILIGLLTQAGSILTNILTNILPSELAPYLKLQFIGPLLGLVILAWIVFAVLQYRWQSTTEQSPSSRYRRDLIGRVQAKWITGVLERSLHGAALIALGLHEQSEAVADPWRFVFQEPDQPEQHLPPGTRIAQVYEKAGGGLVILGESGSGKTTLLLELARYLLNRARQDDNHRIPVVFILSSWSPNPERNFSDWLVEELHSKYRIPPRIGRSWVNTDQVLPLLDGLDEVEEKHREKCVEAINEYRKKHLVPTVVCCRKKEYSVLTKPLELQSTVILQPLTAKQIDDYLLSAGEQLAAVRAVLHNDPKLRELASTPLMLDVLALAYQGKSVDDLLAVDSLAALRRRVFDTYVQYMLQRKGVKNRYMPQQTIRWLSWLGGQMRQHSQTVFYIKKMQTDWLAAGRLRDLHGGFATGLSYWSDWQAPLTGFFVGTFLGFVAGYIIPFFGGFGGLDFWLALGWGFWLTLGLVVGSVIGLVGGLHSGKVIKQSRGWITGWTIGWAIGLISMLPIWLIGWVVGLAIGWVFDLVISLVGLLIALLLSWLATSLGIFGEVAGLIIVLGVLIFHEEIFTLIAEGPIGEFFEPIGEFFERVFDFLFSPLQNWPPKTVGSVRGYIEFITLRLLLWHAGSLPWNYSRFLDYAAERILIDKVGSGYLFKELLLKHFATLDTEQAPRRAERVQDATPQPSQESGSGNQDHKLVLSEEDRSQESTQEDKDFIQTVGGLKQDDGSRIDLFTIRAKRVLRFSHNEAQRFEHNYIGTEHLLLGLIRESEGLAAYILNNLGIKLEKVRSTVELPIGRGKRIVLGNIAFAPRAKKVLELAVDEARRLHHSYVGTEHLLLGLVREGEGLAAKVLESMGVNLEKVRKQTIKALSQPQTTPSQIANTSLTLEEQAKSEHSEAE